MNRLLEALGRRRRPTWSRDDSAREARMEEHGTVWTPRYFATTTGSSFAVGSDLQFSFTDPARWRSP